MNLFRAFKKRYFGIGFPAIPVRGRHVELSVIASADDDPGPPTDRLIDLALKSAHRARGVSMTHVVGRMKNPPYFPDVWPGEHYKFLAGLIAEVEPKMVIEIGTATGLSALAMMSSLGKEAKLYTFDVVPWNEFPDTCLRTEDFADGRLQQIIGDVADPEVMERQAALFRSADLLFVDGPKDGFFEQKLLDHLLQMGLPKQPILLFDDIRVWNMLAIWRRIPKPKMDVTSLGHWSGTGLVHWT